MKKLSLVLAGMFAVGFLMAQNTATVNQFGSNIGQVLQTGSGNGATIQQGFSGAAVSNNLNQPTGWKQGSYIEQIGKANQAATTVRTNGNGTSIYQNGGSNFATQDVGSFEEVTTSLTKMGLDIDQSGDGNHATQKTLMSFGCYGIQGMTILQQGNSNVADQVSVVGMAQVQSIKQIGNNNNLASLNLISTTLVNPLTELTFKFNNGYGTVVGLPMNQYSNQRFGTAIMNVTGDANNTYQFQEYSVWSTSGNNDITLDLIGNNNNVAQGQLGENNNSDLDISRDLNVVSTSQLGNSNLADVDILGSSNVVGIQQTGDLQTATVLQNGNNNFATVVQHF